MQILNQIASQNNRNDESLNIELAQNLARDKNEAGIEEIVSGLSMQKDIANDCIKVLYEIAEIDPQLIIPYTTTLVDLLKSNNNRLVWGAMTALEQVAVIESKTLMNRFREIYEAYETGSVITVDHSISVFAILCKKSESNEQRIFPILIDHFKTCRSKKIPQHLERAGICITFKNVEEIFVVIQKRYKELSKPQLSRVNKFFKQYDIKF